VESPLTTAPITEDWRVRPTPAGTLHDLQKQMEKVGARTIDDLISTAATNARPATATRCKTVSQHLNHRRRTRRRLTTYQRRQNRIVPNRSMHLDDRRLPHVRQSASRYVRPMPTSPTTPGELRITYRGRRSAIQGSKFPRQPTNFELKHVGPDRKFRRTTAITAANL